MAILYRNVSFYHVHAELEKEGKPRVELNPKRLFAAAGALPLEGDPPIRYQESSDGNATVLFIDGSNDNELWGRYGHSRRTGLPSAEKLGQFRDVPLANGEGLFEPSHFVLFESEFLGYEGNHFGPRTGRLEAYLETRLPSLTTGVHIDPILRGELAARLGQLGPIKSIQLAVARDQAAITKQLNSDIFSALKAAAEATQSETIELVWRGRNRSRARFAAAWVKKIPKFLRRPEVKEGLDAFVIEGQNRVTGELDQFDLLRESLTYNVSLEFTQDSNSKRVDDESAYSSIRSAHKAAKPDLEKYKNRTKGE